MCHFAVQKNSTQHCKSSIFNKIFFFFKKRKRTSSFCTGLTETKLPCQGWLPRCRVRRKGSESTQRRGPCWAGSTAMPTKAPGTWLKPSETLQLSLATKWISLSVTSVHRAELPSEALIEPLTHKIMRYKKSITWSKVLWTSVRNLIKEEPNDQNTTVVADYWPVKILIPLFWVHWTLSPSKTWGIKWGRALQSWHLPVMAGGAKSYNWING